MTERTTGSAAALVLGFGTAVAMWVLGFLARLPGTAVPSAVLLTAMLLVLVGGGWRAGRLPNGGVRTGAGTGAVASLVNLLILGGLLSSTGEIVPAAAVWLPGSLLAGALLGALGGWLGARGGSRRELGDATGALAKIGMAATLSLVAVGGLVTSYEAGLAVVDWPNSYGSNMFLFPLTRMVGGIYYEHAHRLFGTLVGLTTLVLCVRIFLTEKRSWVKALGLGALLLVIGQGILGGLRVTGHFTMSDSPEITRPNLMLALVHGVTGQVFFGWMAALAVVTSTTWKRGRLRAGAPGDRILPVVLGACLLVQLLLGVHVRHLGTGTMIHIAFAVVVLLVAVAVAVKTMGSFSDVPVLRKSAGALLGHVTTQLLLGIVAFIAVSRTPRAAPDLFEVVTTTAHQTIGALLLANAVILAIWHRRVELAT